MKKNIQIASWYLHDAQERMKKIADTIGFLSAWSLSRFEVLHHRMQKMSTKTRRFDTAHLCRLDTHFFERLVLEIQKLIENFNDTCEFLAHQYFGRELISVGRYFETFAKKVLLVNLFSSKGGTKS
ncbi:MAG: hypothetical protein KJ687_02510 [Proteobacteria bacterium]|nr:hypothetical protein [Pseudomonadota bacterium]